MSDFTHRGAAVAALSSLTGIDSIAREIAKASSWRDELERSLRPSLAIQEQIHQAKTSLSASAFARDHLATNSVAKMLEEQQRLVRDAIGPLAQLRAESIWEREHAQLFASAQSSISLQSYAKTIADTQFSAMEAARKAYEGINDTAKSIMDSLDAERRAMIEAASRPYVSLVESFARENASVKALRDMVDGASWIKQLKLPIIDAASAAAVAKTWGMEGALREISSLGLDAQTMQAFATSFAGMGNVGVWEADDDAGDKPGAAKGPRRLSPEMWLSIFCVLLAILVPIWQKMDSDAAEARLNAEIKGISVQLDDHEKKSAERLEALTRMVDRMMEQSATKAMGEVDFVVRSRVALIRAAGKSGSHVVAEVFPNQVVKLVSENGKWIEVRYFDWNAQEERSGWALKKYFLRVNAGAAVAHPVVWEDKQ
jgi:hypothetical protein